MNYPADLVEEQIASADEAWEILNNKKPEFKELYDIWYNWYVSKTSDKALQQVIIDAFVISYARMALRNGSLSINPRSYHNETHIDDLIYRLIAVSQHDSSKTIPSYGWSLLSVFMSAHDLRQSEIKNTFDIIGDNEQASYQELMRLISHIDSQKVIRQEHKELLKLMIHGSTFGQGEDTKGNVYKGNLVNYLLNKVGYFEGSAKEIAYLSCDIDTANVSAGLLDYAHSSLNVYEEIQNLSNGQLSAHAFFGPQQNQYFFELQNFNSQLGKLVFSEQKTNNAPKIKSICQAINKLDRSISNKEVVEFYLSQIKSHL